MEFKYDEKAECWISQWMKARNVDAHLVQYTIVGDKSRGFICHRISLFLMKTTMDTQTHFLTYTQHLEDAKVECDRFAKIDGAKPQED